MKRVNNINHETNLVIEMKQHKTLNNTQRILRQDNQASANVIGNIMMVVMTLLLVSVVAVQGNNIWESANLPASIDEALGRDNDQEAKVTYKTYYEEPNLTITLLSVSKRVEIPRVNYVLYNLSINEKDETGYLIDVKNSNDTMVHFVDFDGDGHFSRSDKIIIQFGPEGPYGDYLIELRDNRHADLKYDIRLREEDFAKI
jgi:hypothetical protein